MRKLHAAAVSKGVVLLNEVGLDPGIDHMVSWHSMPCRTVLWYHAQRSDGMGCDWVGWDDDDHTVYWSDALLSAFRLVLCMVEHRLLVTQHNVTSHYFSPPVPRHSLLTLFLIILLLHNTQLIMKAVNSIHDRGGKVTELVSLCGGLPDPVAAENPFKYKISWSPRGVLSAATNRWISLITVTLKGLLNLVGHTSHFLHVFAFVAWSSTIPDKLY